MLTENIQPEPHWLDRTRLLLGDEAMERLASLRVAVLGLGGVGGAAAEAICRAGVGHMLIADHDTVDITNLNRQLLATADQLGKPKVQAGRERLLSIHPQLDLVCEQAFYLPENRDFLFRFQPNIVIDAIDTVTAKLDLSEQCRNRNIFLLSSLGTGNRLDPGALQIGDISETAGCGCPLARVMRRELKKRGISQQTVLFSTEQPQKAVCPQSENGRHSPASCAFVPPAAGYLLASFAIRYALGLVTLTSAVSSKSY